MFIRKMKASCFSFILAILLLAIAVMFERFSVFKESVLFLNALSWGLFLCAFLLSKKDQSFKLSFVVRLVSLLFVILPFVMYLIFFYMNLRVKQ